MGAKQSKRSVDITTTPKKGDSDPPMEGEGKVEKISDLEAKITTNGAIHTEIEFADKEENEKGAEDDVMENGVSDSEVPKTPEADVSVADQLNESSDVAEKSPQDSAEKSEENAESNKKGKDKPKKMKWSFRSISFSKKDKSKPGKESKKNGDVKEVTEESTHENAASPTVEVPTSENESNAAADDASATAVSTNDAAATATAAAEVTPITNGEVITEEATNQIKVAEPIEESKEISKVTEELKVELVLEKPVEMPPIESKISIEQNEESNAVITESKEHNEVCSEEVPPPLPSSNPPSPVTVFAESTMAETLPTEQTATDVVEPVATPVVVELEPPSNSALESPKAEENISDICALPVEATNVVSPITESSPEPVQEPALEVTNSIPESPTTCQSPEPIQASASDNTKPEPSEPEDALPEPTSLLSDPIPNGTDHVINADSLPDISTESLPSLPEPVSESLPEPMSLPPVDCIPEPIIISLNSETETISNIPVESKNIPEPIAEIDMVLTNGEANGLPSPVATNDDMLPSVERPIKQVVLPTENLPTENAEGERHDAGDKIESEPTPAKVEE